MNIVVMISADIEWQTILELHPCAQIFQSPMGEWFIDNLDVFNHKKPVRYFHGGWGKIAAAASTQYAIDQWKPDLLINLGTCGGIEGEVEKGTIILVDCAIVYDLIEQMGDSISAIDHYTTRLDLSWLGTNYPIRVLKTSIISGDKDLLVEELQDLKQRYNARVGDWESGAIAYVASRNQIPLLILRGVTDLVSSAGGEAYGHFELFEQASQTIMQGLDRSLSGWIEIAGML
ncbi:MAG: 5'-methylthioadenosine/S-adenosylhomocysteine nucleosidase [Anaerolineaceae bacterium]